MEDLVRCLIDQQKEFQEKFLGVLENQNKILDKQNRLLEKLFEKYEIPEENPILNEANDCKRSLYETEFLEDFEDTPEKKMRLEETETVENEESQDVEPESEQTQNIFDTIEEELEEEIEVVDKQPKIHSIKSEIEQILQQQEELSIRREHPTIINFPLDDINTLFEIEEESQTNPEFEQYLEKVFQDAVPSDEIRFSNCGLNKLLTDSVISLMNWGGDQGKVRMGGMYIFKTVLKRAWSGFCKTDEDFMRIVKLHLKAAKRRLHTANSRRRSQITKQEMSISTVLGE